MSRTEPLTELEEHLVAEAESDLQQLLAIEPSPEFPAKVRARIHETREPSAKRWGWMGVAIASASAAVIVIAVLRMEHGSPATHNVEFVRRPDINLSAPAPLEHGPTLPTLASRAVPVRQVPRRMTEPAATAEIIIDRAMTDAIRRMAMSVRNTEPDASTAEQLQIQMGEPAPLTIAEPLNVPELVLKPADQNGGNQE
jgi:hypothetical protein